MKLSLSLLPESPVELLKRSYQTFNQNMEVSLGYLRTNSLGERSR